MTDSKKNRILKRRWLWVLGSIALLIVLWQLVADRYREEEKQLRRQLRETVKESFPEQTEEFSKTFGLVLFESSSKAAAAGGADGKTVVLIHGLDDPGKVWRNLAPALDKIDFNVW